MANELSEVPTSYGSETSPRIKDEKGRRARNRGGVVNVFLSHKHKDYAAADQIQLVLRRNSAGQINVFMSENIMKGEDWQERIEKQLYDTDWFVLLFSGTSEDWAWCHHEAGIFRGMMYPDANRIVVLYPPNVALPDPLKKYQAVKCQSSGSDQPDDLDRFFVNMFGEPPYTGIDPINDFFAHHDHEARRLACDTIIDVVGRLVVETIEPDSRLIVRISDIDQLEHSRFPEESRVLLGSSALRLFNVGNAEFDWQQFHDALNDRPEVQQYLGEHLWPVVCHACYRSAMRRRLMPIHTIFRAPADDRNYHPVLSRIDISGDGSAIFYIDFVQVAVSSQIDVRDKSVARIFTALNLAHRFRWEIIDPYHEVDRLREFVETHARTTNREPNGEGSNGAGLATVWEAIRLIEIEAQNRGVSDDNALPADFGPSARARISAMFPLWQEKRHQLEQAKSDGDVATFARVLTELDPINVEFISLACRRLGELVRGDARHEYAAWPRSAAARP